MKKVIFIFGLVMVMSFLESVDAKSEDLKRDETIGTLAYLLPAGKYKGDPAPCEVWVESDSESYRITLTNMNKFEQVTFEVDKESDYDDFSSNFDEKDQELKVEVEQQYEVKSKSELRVEKSGNKVKIYAEEKLSGQPKSNSSCEVQI